MDLERRVFLRQLVQRQRHLFLIGFSLGFNCYGDDGYGKCNGFQQDGMFFVADGIAGGDVLQSDHGADIARHDLGDVFALVGVHLQQAANALGPAFARAQHALA